MVFTEGDSHVQYQLYVEEAKFSGEKETWEEGPRQKEHKTSCLSQGILLVDLDFKEDGCFGTGSLHNSKPGRSQVEPVCESQKASL